MPSETGKAKALETTLASLKKRYGEGAIMKLGETASMKVDAISTGSISLDLALGIGGIPRGRVTEIYGPEASGKTTLCQHIIAEAQKRGGVAAFIDVEHALDPQYAARCGVNTVELLISQPDTGEQALEIAEALVRSGAVDVIVIEPGSVVTEIWERGKALAESSLPNWELSIEHWVLDVLGLHRLDRRIFLRQCASNGQLCFSLLRQRVYCLLSFQQHRVYKSYLVWLSYGCVCSAFDNHDDNKFNKQHNDNKYRRYHYYHNYRINKQHNDNKYRRYHYYHNYRINKQHNHNKYRRRNNHHDDNRRW